MSESVATDPRFLRGVILFNSRDYLDASEEFEDLYFETVSEEREFVRFFMQISVGLHHIERGQRHAAVERLLVGVETLGEICSDRGYDLAGLARQAQEVIALLRNPLWEGREDGAIPWPAIEVHGEHATVSPAREKERFGE